MAGPIVFHDELAPIGLARHLREGLPFPHVGVPFYPGYGVLLALFSPDVVDPARVHLAARALDAGLLAVSFLAALALTRFLFEREASWRGRCVVALAACLHAPLVLMGHMALPDNALVTGGVAAMLAVARALDRPSTARFGVAGLALGLLPLVHVRAAPVVGAGVVGLAWGATRGAPGWIASNRRAWLVFALALASALALAWIGAEALAHAAPPPIVRMARAHSVARVSSRSLGEFAPRLPFVVAGHGLYLGLSTLGLVWIAFAAGLRRARGRPGEAPDAARQGTALAIVLASAGTWAMSAMFFNTGVHRADHVLSGRYCEAAILPLLALGLASLSTRGASRSVRTSAIAGLAAGAGTAALGSIAAQVQRFAVFDHPFNPATVLAIHPWLGHDASPDLGRLAMVGGVLAAAGVALALARPRVFVAAWVASALALTWSVSNGFLVPGSQDRASQRVVADALAHVERRFGAIDCIAIDNPTWSLWHAHHDQFLRPRQRFELFDSRTGQPSCSELVVSADRDLARAYPGARLLARERDDVERLWILPGEWQSRLAAAGFLEPTQWGEMPAAAMRSGLAWRTPPPATIPVHGPSNAAVISLTHRGTASPWLARAEVGGAALAVRIGVRWLAADGTGRPLGESHADLPYALLPGAQVEIPIVLPGDGVALAPGRYRLVVGVLQEGVRWFRDLGDGVLMAEISLE